MTIPLDLQQLPITDSTEVLEQCTAHIGRKRHEVESLK